jgi:hypothetical protein
MNKLDKIKCWFGNHTGEIIKKERTKEVDYVSGCYLTRNVLHCVHCKKSYYKRTDNIIGIDDKGWNWITTDYFFLI